MLNLVYYEEKVYITATVKSNLIPIKYWNSNNNKNDSIFIL